MSKDYSPTVTAPNAQRRPELMLNDEEAHAVLDRAQVGHIATAWDGLAAGS